MLLYVCVRADVCRQDGVGDDFHGSTLSFPG